MVSTTTSKSSPKSPRRPFAGFVRGTDRVPSRPQFAARCVRCRLALMPRYLIERTYTVDMDSVPAVATRSKAIGHHRYPEIVWEHSHVVLDAEGTPKSFCVYAAPSEEMVREHAERLGDHSIAV